MQRQEEFLQNAPRIVQAALNNDSGGVGSEGDEEEGEKLQ